MISAKTVLSPPQEAATTAHGVSFTSCAVVQVDYRLSVIPCPHCDDNAPAIGQATRSAIDIDLEQPALLWVLVSVHRCEHCDSYFRAQPPFLREGAVYTRQVVAKAIASVYQDGMAYRRVADRLARDFWVRPSEVSIRRWCRAYSEHLDFLADYQPWVVESFSGLLCVDEVYQGQLALLLAVDPLRGDRLVGYQLLPLQVSAGPCQAG